MKKIQVLSLIGALLALTVSANAEDLLGFSVKGTQVETNLEYTVVPLTGQGVPMVTFMDVTSDNATGAITFKTHSNPTLVTTAQGSAGTNITCVGTGYASNDVLVVYHRTGNTYERAVVWSASATNINTTVALGTATAVGDTVYEMTAAGTATVGDANKQLIAAGGLYFGTKGYPLLIELSGDGTNTVNINVVSGQYIK